MRRRRGLPSSAYLITLLAIGSFVAATKTSRWVAERPELIGQQTPPCRGTDIFAVDWILRLCDDLDAIVRVDLRDRVVTAHPFSGEVVAVAMNPRGEVALATSEGPILIVDHQLRELGQFHTGPLGRAWGLEWIDDRWEAVDLSGVYTFDGTERNHIPHPPADNQWYRFLGIERVRGRWAQLWQAGGNIVSYDAETTQTLCALEFDEASFAISQRAMMRGRGLLVRDPLYIELADSPFQPSRRFEAASFWVDRTYPPDAEETTCLRVRRKTDTCERFFLLDSAGLDFADRCSRGGAQWLGDRDLLSIDSSELSLNNASVRLPEMDRVLFVDPRGQPVVLDPGMRHALVYNAELKVEVDLWLEHRASVVAATSRSKPVLE